MEPIARIKGMLNGILENLEEMWAKHGDQELPCISIKLTLRNGAKMQMKLREIKDDVLIGEDRQSSMMLENVLGYEIIKKKKKKQCCDHHCSTYLEE